MQFQKMQDEEGFVSVSNKNDEMVSAPSFSITYSPHCPLVSYCFATIPTLTIRSVLEVYLIITVSSRHRPLRRVHPNCRNQEDLSTS
ncbi:hypothetical protein ABKN59_011599 [Abortiporus biennis]